MMPERDGPAAASATAPAAGSGSGGPGALVVPLLFVAVLAGAALGGLWLAGALSAEGVRTPVGEIGAWDRLVAWILAQQAGFHRTLTGELEGLQGERGATAVLAAGALVAASFLYGVFHAAGPGHGKAVIATYLLTQRQEVRRGVALAAASSFCQGAVALVLVYGLVGIAGWLPRETGQAVAWSERLSFLLVGGVGLLLMLRAASGLWRLRRGPAEAGTCDSHHHHHRHRHHSHHHADDAGAHDDCGHLPSATQLAAARDWRADLGIVLSIGLRPCSGAIVVLVFARAVGLAWAGVASVFAVSLGTAVAVSLLAWLVVHARRSAVALAESSERLGRGGLGRAARVAGLAAGLAGGLVILALGASLLSASFAPVHPLGLG